MLLQTDDFDSSGWKTKIHLLFHVSTYDCQFSVTLKKCYLRNERDCYEERESLHPRNKYSFKGRFRIKNFFFSCLGFSLFIVFILSSIQHVKLSWNALAALNEVAKGRFFSLRQIFSSWFGKNKNKYKHLWWCTMQETTVPSMSLFF